ncbi:hypothetical protein [Celerinatantimonas sp. YJH-8]|uniref:hypothetical protein n=1 Tax=Celerinatantimonas sp. YJH-8 TaxID=3228714 RepID=UPI0038C58736
MIDKLAIHNKQRKIKGILLSLGWSINKFASRYMIDNSDYDVEEDEILRFQEKVKKQLSRLTVSELKNQALDDYLQFLEGTDEYHKIKDKIKLPSSLTGFINDYQLILNEERSKVARQVLEVAAAYALSLGAALAFNVVATADQMRYLVIWEGDIGYRGCWEPAICEVIKNSEGRFYVQQAELHFHPGLCFIDDVIAYDNNQLILSGYRYDRHDPVVYPTLKYWVTLTKDSDNAWQVIEEHLIKKEILNTSEFGINHL